MHEIDRRWKVGELARATGLTIRALHHYDEIGLLVPGRTESGHRVYAPADIERLYRVLALRGVGMGLDAIAAVLDDDSASLVEAVRRHLAAVERDIERRERLRERLREMLLALERSPARPVDELLGAVAAMSVVEATIEDVFTREAWDEAGEQAGLCVVLLREAGDGRLLPIWIGEPEAAALVIQRQGARLPRPMGPDLTVALLGAVDARVDRVVVERLQDDTFFATVTVTSGGEPHEVDARPSDALNLALRSGAPILVAEELMRTAGLERWPDGGETDASAPPWLPLAHPRRLSRMPPHTVGDDAPDVLRRAAAEARALGHGWVGSAHLLLGILADQEDVAAQLLTRHGLTLAAAREAVAAMLADARMPPPQEATFITPQATLTLRRALVAARSGGHEEPAPSHVLRALIDTSGAATILNGAAVDFAALRADLPG